jgi:DNA-binding NtrC family response regulator
MGYGRGSARVAEKAAVRTVVLASADSDFRQRLYRQLTAMRWEVRLATGGAEAMAQLETAGAEALLVDSWLPDLEVGEFTAQMRGRHPGMDLLRIDGGFEESGARSPRRNELLHALRHAQAEASGGSTERPAWAGAPVAAPQTSAADQLAPRDERAAAAQEVAEYLRTRRSVSSRQGVDETADVEIFGEAGVEDATGETAGPEIEGRLGSLDADHTRLAGPWLAAPELGAIGGRANGVGVVAARANAMALPDVIGESAGMRELARMVRLVAPRSTTVLIEGATGTGKELVAKAVHRLSARASKPFVVLNCAAIPESLLEAELFGHTRGAFTGAVQSRTGRVEAANGGTLFLDEIGEMPLALQAKMLRFLESGEIQRVGGNETVRVDVRVVAATHQPLKQRTAERAFRLDLYHRLAVFPVSVPALCERMEDVPSLATFFLERLGEEMPVKRLSAGALKRLMEHDWPGNVRELAHVLERATILAEDRPEIAAGEIRP